MGFYFLGMKKIQIHELYDLYLKHRKISTDSRDIKAGDLFFALKGENFNGNKFALDAVQNGASFAIVDEAIEGDHSQILYTENSLQTLQDLAQLHRRNLNIPVIGITGTNGKTTTKELVYSVLSRRFKTFATVGNLNNHIGVPLSILSIDESCEIAVIEMGANHIGEIEFLCGISNPGFGLITNIGIAHIEGFGSLEGIIEAKTELYKYIEGSNGIVFINIMDDLLLQHAGKLKKETYGPDLRADCVTQLIFAHPALQVGWTKGNINYTINSNLYGSYNFQNISAAIIIGNHFEVAPEDIKAGIESYHPENNRSQLIKTSNNTLFMDAYNANPSSMELAIQNFHSIPDKNKVLILGDMMELGDVTQQEHQKVIELAQSFHFKKLIFVGEYFNKLLTSKELGFPNVQEARSWLLSNPLEGCSILIKGSRKIELEKLLEVL